MRQRIEKNFIALRLFTGLSAGVIFVENVRLQIGRLELSYMDWTIYIKKDCNTPGSVYRQFHVACTIIACDRRRELNGK
jgi:hypothetical protein